MKKILLLSDNHGHVDDAILHHAKWADEVWHAGDWLNDALLLELEEKGHVVRGVYGNADGMELRRIFPLHNRFTLEGVRVWMTHIGGYPGKYNPAIRQELKVNTPDLFVCGHSHILRVDRDKAHSNMLCMNPGACGLKGFHIMRTALRFVLDSGQVKQPEIIEFGLKSEWKGGFPNP